MKQYSQLLPLLLWAQLFATAQAPKPGALLATNLTCESLDTSYLRFNRCSLDKNSQQKTVININVHPYHTITSAMMYVKLSRQVNRKYQLFLYEDKIDICDFLKSAKRHIFWGILYRAVLQYSNINHSCPYNHDLIISNLSMKAKELKATPLPRGNYVIEMKAEIDNVIITTVALFFSRS